MVGLVLCSYFIFFLFFSFRSSGGWDSVHEVGDLLLAVHGAGDVVLAAHEVGDIVLTVHGVVAPPGGRELDNNPPREDGS